MHLFAQIRKVDEAQRLVYGRAAQEVVDKSDEIMDYESSKPHFMKWSEEVAKDTDGKSLGNVRAMHGKVAAGKLTAIDFDDAGKAIDVCAKVIDDAEWTKVLEGVYTGFSIGGAYVGAKKIEKHEGRDIARYTAKPSELSLVDRPCIPTAKFFEVQKADGTSEEVPFKEPEPEAAAAVEEPADVTVNGTPDEVAELGKAMNEKGLSIGDVIAKINVPAVEKLEGTLCKGAYDCHTFSEVLTALICLQKSAAHEAEVEGDGSDLPARISALVALCGDVFKQAIDEACAEVKEGTEAPASLVTLAQQAGELGKALEGASYAATDADPLFALVKFGARNSKSDSERIQKLHDLAKELDAKCAKGDDMAMAAKADLAELVKVADAAAAEAIEKVVADALAPLQKALDEAQARVAKLEAQPAPARVALRAIAKAEDVIPDSVQPQPAPEPVRDSFGDAHEAAGLIKSLHRTGGAPLALRK